MIIIILFFIMIGGHALFTTLMLMEWWGKTKRFAEKRPSMHEMAPKLQCCVRTDSDSSYFAILYVLQFLFY